MRPLRFIGSKRRGREVPLRFIRPIQERAAALLLVLWAMILLSAAVIAWAKWVEQDIIQTGEANRQAEARIMANSGITMALNKSVSQNSPQLKREFGTQLGYQVRMVGEGSRINLNWIVAGANELKLNFFKQWLERMELDYQDRETLVDCLLDYVDSDDLRRNNGCESEADYLPANRPLLTVDEFRKVRGSEPITSKPGWKDLFTIYSTGQIDLSVAPVEVLRAIPGFGDARIQRFLIFRSGKDGLLGTIDDHVFKSLREIQLFLGMTDAQFKQIEGLIMLKDPIVHITSLGHSAKVIRQVEVVARKGGGANPAILYWNE